MFLRSLIQSFSSTSVGFHLCGFQFCNAGFYSFLKQVPVLSRRFQFSHAGCQFSHGSRSLPQGSCALLYGCSSVMVCFSSLKQGSSSLLQGSGSLMQCSCSPHAGFQLYMHGSNSLTQSSNPSGFNNVVFSCRLSCRGFLFSSCRVPVHAGF